MKQKRPMTFCAPGLVGEGETNAFQVFQITRTKLAASPRFTRSRLKVKSIFKLFFLNKKKKKKKKKTTESADKR